MTSLRGVTRALDLGLRFLGLRAKSKVWYRRRRSKIVFIRWRGNECYSVCSWRPRWGSKRIKVVKQKLPLFQEPFREHIKKKLVEVCWGREMLSLAWSIAVKQLEAMISLGWGWGLRYARWGCDSFLYFKHVRRESHRSSLFTVSFKTRTSILVSRRFPSKPRANICAIFSTIRVQDYVRAICCARPNFCASKKRKMPRTETLGTQARHLLTNACSAGVRHHQAAMNWRTSVRLKVYMYIKA